MQWNKKTEVFYCAIGHTAAQVQKQILDLRIKRNYMQKPFRVAITWGKTRQMATFGNRQKTNFKCQHARYIKSAIGKTAHDKLEEQP